MSTLTKMSLEDLYARRITSNVEEAIIEKEDFSRIVPQWCDKVCRLKGKNPHSSLLTKATPEETDVVILEDYRAPDTLSFGEVIPSNEMDDRYKKLWEDLIVKSKCLPSSSKAVTLQVLKCTLTKDALINGVRVPNDIVISKCRPYVLNEIRRLKPKVIISLTTIGTKVLGIKKSNYSNVGEIHSFEGIPVVLTLHPRILFMLRQNSTGAFWGPDFYSIISNDFAKAGKLLRGELKIPDLESALVNARSNIWIVKDERSAKHAVELLTRLGKEQQVLSVDTETTSLDPFAPNAKLLTIQFGYLDKVEKAYKAIVFPLWHRENKWYDPNKIWNLIVPLLTDSSIKKIGHNIKFDIMYIYTTTGIRLAGLLADTMLLLHAINSGLQGCYGLKRAVWNWLPETELGGYEDKLPALTEEIEEEESKNENI